MNKRKEEFIGRREHRYEKPKFKKIKFDGMHKAIGTAAVTGSSTSGCGCCSGCCSACCSGCSSL